MNKRLSIAELLNVSALIGHVCPGNFREGLPIVGTVSCFDTEYATCADYWDCPTERAAALKAQTPDGTPERGGEGE